VRQKLTALQLYNVEGILLLFLKQEIINVA